MKSKANAGQATEMREEGRAETTVSHSVSTPTVYICLREAAATQHQKTAIITPGLLLISFLIF